MARLGFIALVLSAETLLASYLIQATPIDSLTGPAAALRQAQHWLFRFLIAYAVSLAMLGYLKAGALAPAFPARAPAPLRARYAVVHALLLVPFAYLSAMLYASASPLPFALTALAWHGCAAALALSSFASLAPLSVWTDIVRRMGRLVTYALLPAGAAVLAIHVSQRLWAPAARLTFHIVRLLLAPFRPALYTDPSTLTLGTDRFAVTIADVCSGLEGVGLMLAFCAAWLWFFRRDYYFPRALVVVPLGVILVFLLNSVRIAALVLIGDAGYERVALVGFHSQAGWIGFNLAAFLVAILAHTHPWLSRAAPARRAARARVNMTGAYLMPLLVILAAGMVAHALSTGFELLYPLRLAGALAALWAYRRGYSTLDLHFGWRGPLTGVAVFALWLLCAHWLIPRAGEPPALASLSAPLAISWILCRVLAAVFTVPVAEELAYRGYLMRRLVDSRFERVPYSAVRWPALALSALAFGLMHGALWLPATVAGVAYGMLAMRSGKLGDSIAAHGTANALLAAAVLGLGQWQLW